MITLHNTYGALRREPSSVFGTVDGEHFLIYTEAWIPAEEPAPVLPGYVAYHFPRPVLDPSLPPRGGIVVYARADVARSVSLGHRDAHSRYAWLHLHHEAGLGDDLALCVAYLAPRRCGALHEADEDLWVVLGEEIVAAQGRGLVLVAGDMNARPRGRPDWVVDDSDEHNIALQDALAVGEGGPSPTRVPRRSQDRGTSTGYASELLHLCQSTGMRIANGRVAGDGEGACTCYPVGGGSSQVDFFLGCPRLFPLLSRLEVRELDAHSDHCRVSLRVSLPARVHGGVAEAGDEGTFGMTLPGPAAPIWDPKKAEQWQGLLRGPAVQSLLAGVVRDAAAAADSEGLQQVLADLRSVVDQSLREAMPQDVPSARAKGQRRTSRVEVRRQVNRARREVQRQLRLAGPESHAYRQAAKEYRRLAARLKRELRRTRGALAVKLAAADMAAFWRKVWGPMGRAGHTTTPAITPRQWYDYFKGLLAKPLAPLPVRESPAHSPIHPQPHEANPQPFDGPFTAAEVQAAIPHLKRRAAVTGFEQVNFLKGGCEALAPAIAAIFNACRRLGTMSALAVSTITPILKAGDPMQPGNYRGIAVGTLLAKLYAILVNTRVTEWAEGAGLRAAGQAGFRKDHRTADQIFVLRTLVESARAKGSPLYTCFVDFKKAYDLVDRRLLWDKLQRRGMPSGLLDAAKALYGDVPMCVRTHEGLTPLFESTIGVKQGCPLSPTLFGLFLDDLEQWVVGADAVELPTLHGQQVPPLLYADDLLLVSVSAAGLQAQLGVLERYCERWGMTVNVEKTKVVVFPASSRSREGQAPRFTYQGERLATAPSFRYLGVEVHRQQVFGPVACAELGRAGLRALHAMRRKLSQIGTSSFWLQRRLFQALVLPVVSYGCEVWAPQFLRGGGENACERLQRSFLRHAMGRLPQGTPASVVLAEAGFYPLAIHWGKLVTRFWNRLVGLPETRVTKWAFLEQLDLARAHGGAGGVARQPWGAQVVSYLSSLGLDPLDGGEPRAVDVTEACALADTAYVAGVLEGAPAKPKVQHYCTRVRGGLTLGSYSRRPQPYLSAVDNRAHLASLARFRTGSHWLRVETGRREGLDRPDRTCPHCLGGVEDEPHMVFDCPKYAHLRVAYSESLFGGGQAQAQAAPRPSLADFLSQDPVAVASFVHQCYRLSLAGDDAAGSDSEPQP